MPFTYLAHQLPVLPLRRRVERLDGVALVIGSMAPDFSYVVRGTQYAFNAHTLVAQLWWSLPVTLVLCVAVRAVAIPLAAHLPDAGPFQLRAYGACGERRHPLPIVVLSALIGALTHLVLDSFTHRDGWVVVNVPWLWRTWLVDIGDRFVTPFEVLQVVGSIVFAWLALAWLASDGGRTVLRGGPRPALPPTTPASRALFAGCAALGLAAGVAATVLVPDGGFPAAAIRVTTALGAGLLVGARLAAAALPTPAAEVAG